MKGTPFTVQRVELSDLTRPRTKIMMNVGNRKRPSRCPSSPMTASGWREGVHHLHLYKGTSLALLNYDRLDDAAVKAEIDRLTVGYADKAQFFVDKLAQGVAMIAAAFYPKDVIVRLSDFKSNEYANLIGGGAMSRQRKIL